MPGTWFGIENARRGMQVHQHALDITGHNLANASTPGYTRQEAVMSPTDPYSNPTLNSAVTPGQFGTGVEVSMIRRVKDEYLDHQVRRAATDTAYWEEQVSILQRAEASFAEPDSEGIGQRIVDFFKSWMDLNNTPQDPGIKAAVVQIGDELASLMSYTYNQLTDVEKSVERPQIDVYANKVAGDSGPVKITTRGTYTDAVDKTYLVKITGDNGTEATTAEYSTDGGTTWNAATVTAGGVVDVGSGIIIDAASGMGGTGTDKTVYQFNVYASPTTGKLSQQVARVNDILVQIRNLTDSIKKVYDTGQQPNDLLDKRDQLLEELSMFGPVGVSFETVGGKPTGDLSELTLFGVDVKPASTNTLDLTTDGGKITLKAYGATNVINLTDNCNDTSKGGSLLGLEKTRQNLIEFKAMLNDLAVSMRDKIKEKNVEPPAASPPDFFTGDLASGNFRVNTTLLSNPEMLDGTKAKDIANLRDQEISTDKQFTFEEYYSLLITKVGGSAKSTDDMAANQAAISQQITGLRDSVSGVSIDEELTKMLQFQYGFQASARMINTLDDMLDVIINRLF